MGATKLGQELENIEVGADSGQIPAPALCDTMNEVLSQVMQKLIKEKEEFAKKFQKNG
jgi:hypothetical protein